MFGWPMNEIKLATVLLGATPFKEGNVNDTYRGPVLIDESTVKQAIIKDLNPLELCNELLAHCLAKKFGLPIPDCYLGLVRPNILTASKGPVLSDSSRLVFVSVDVKVPNVTFRLTGSNTDGQKALLAEMAGWTGLGSLYAFDAWIANVDRHPGNFLFGNPGDAWIIDHGHSFTGATWNVDDLDPAKEFANRLSEWMTPMLTTDQRMTRKSEVSAFESSLTSFDADGASSASHINSLLASERVVALEAFLEGRIGVVTIHASKALGVPVIL
jgi:hypothetical protein